MKRSIGLLVYLAAGIVAIACNAVLGLEEKKLGSGDENGARSGNAGSGGNTRGGSTSGGNAGENPGGGGSAGGQGGADGGDCTPGDERSCRTVYPTLLGNCSRGTVSCDESGAWGPCSIEPENADSCDDEGDDADCDGTPNGGCPCLSGE